VDFKTRTDRGDAGSSSATRTRASARCQEASATEEREKANPSCVYYDSDDEHGVVFGDEEDELIVGDEERPANYPTTEEKYTPWRQRPPSVSPVLKEATTGATAGESTTVKMLNDGYRALQRSEEGESLEIGDLLSHAHTSICAPGVQERAPEGTLMSNTISVGMHWVTGTAVSTQVSDCWLISLTRFG
jgi:hypothetical protein